MAVFRLPEASGRVKFNGNDKDNLLMVQQLVGENYVEAIKFCSGFGWFWFGALFSLEAKRRPVMGLIKIPFGPQMTMASFSRSVVDI